MKILDGIEHFLFMKEYNWNGTELKNILYTTNGDMFFAVKGGECLGNKECEPYKDILYILSTKLKEDITYPTEHLRAFIRGYLREKKLKRILE